MMRLELRWVIASGSLLVLLIALTPPITMMAAPLRPVATAPDAFETRVRPILERYCIDCHGEDGAEAGINLDRFENQEAAFKEGGRTWLRVRDALQGGIMPPADEDQPSLDERERVVGWVENDYLPAQCGQGARSPPVVIRRLNRQEYNNTIRDLLGLDLRLADAFPPDDIGFGFDNARNRETQHLVRARREVSRRRRGRPAPGDRSA